MKNIPSKLAIAAMAAICLSDESWAAGRSVFGQLPGSAQFSSQLPVPKAAKVATKWKKTRVDSCEAYSGLVQMEAQRQGVPASLVFGTIRTESSCRPSLVGAAGEIGLMQIKPSTARGMGLRNTRELYNPAVNIHYGVKYLKEQLNRFGGNTRMASAAYNGGPGGARSRAAQAYAGRVAANSGYVASGQSRQFNSFGGNTRQSAPAAYSGYTPRQSRQPGSFGGNTRRSAPETYSGISGNRDNMALVYANRLAAFGPAAVQGKAWKAYRTSVPRLP
jgi:soluble lytic murein transglycosylase-like protein